VSTYRVREATLEDLETLVRHRVAMFADMDVEVDAPALATAYRAWLRATMPAGEYYAWVCETEMREIVAGGGLSLFRWPPGPRPATGDRLAFVYNVYTEPAHRKRGLARRLMDAIHSWCGAHGVGAVALNAAPAARHLYESQGYRPAPSPMMWKIT
jgi:GNAT superfamily N-acetyltransferase